MDMTIAGVKDKMLYTVALKHNPTYFVAAQGLDKMKTQVDETSANVIEKMLHARRGQQ